MNELTAELGKLLESHPNEIHFSREVLNDFVNLLKANEKYSPFFDHCHNIGPHSGTCFNGEIEFPNAIIKRAKEAGSEQAFKEVNDYLNSEFNNLECGLLLYSVHIDSEFQFSNNVRIIKTSSLNSASLTQFLSKESISTGGLNTAFLTIDFLTKKKIESSIATDEKRKADWTNVKEKTRLLSILNDTRLLLSLARHHDYGIPVVSSFEIIPDNLTILSSGIAYSPFSEPRQGIGPSIIEIEYSKADTLISQFNSLSDENQDKLRVALKRLNDVKIDSDWANKNINLRICLENLFYNGEGLIAKTISERAPLYTNFSKNRARNVYKFLSSAVHSGRPAEHDNITVIEITEQIHKTILKFLEEGQYPSWPATLKPNRMKRLIKCVKSIFE